MSFGERLRRRLRPAGPVRPSSAWWNEPVDGAVRAPVAGRAAPRQIEFWEMSGTEGNAPAKTSEPVSLHVGAVERSTAVCGVESPRKGRVMSPVGMGRFLKMGGSIYDGHDESRWFALPERKKSIRFEFLRETPATTADRRAMRSAVRVGTSRSDGL